MSIARNSGDTPVDQGSPLLPAAPSAAAESSSRAAGRGSLRRQIVIAVVCFSLALAGGLAINAVNSAAPGAGGGLVAERARLNFGEVWLNDRFEWSLPVRNSSARDFQIETIITPCDCSEVTRDFAGEIIAADAEITLPLRINLFAAAKGPPVDRAPIDVSIMIYGSGPAPPCELHVVGTARRALRLTPVEISLDDALIEGGPHESRAIAVEPAVPLGKIEVICSEALGTAVLKESAAGPIGPQYSLEFTPAAALPRGPIATQILLLATTKDGESLPPLRLPVSGHVLPHVRATPEIVDFGLCEVGKPARGTILLQSVTRTPFTIAKATPVIAAKTDSGQPAPLDKSPLTFAWTKGDARAEQNVEVALVPETAGHFEATVEFTVSTSGGPDRQVSVKVRGYVQNHSR